ncbi:MAG: hypothetical protein KKE23_00640 [Nanoarchaeota archaeon]|nr:hypothetical protein [Nanoarchaeota archaeon]
MNFLKQKKDFLSKPDKSGIGGIDEDIRKLVDIINKNPNYYTTSSCAGRIILMRETGEKQENVFIFVTHKKASVGQITTAIKLDKRATDLMYLKEEPCIMHVACKSIEHANDLVNSARQSGWKKSGIISIKPEKVMAELISTEILAAPITSKGKVMVDETYLDFLIKESNKKLGHTREKIKNFENAFRSLK